MKTEIYRIINKLEALAIEAEDTPHISEKLNELRQELFKFLQSNN